MQEELNKGMADIDIQDDVSVFISVWIPDLWFFSPFDVIDYKNTMFLFYPPRNGEIWMW